MSSCSPSCSSRAHGRTVPKLGEVVSQDCDPARYRTVLDVLSACDRRSASTDAIELRMRHPAMPVLAPPRVRHLQRKDKVRWFRAMQIEFLARSMWATRARDALARPRRSGRTMRARAIERQPQPPITPYWCARPPSGTPPTPRMRERMALADHHGNRQPNRWSAAVPVA
ncbi:MAG: hypothetical protein ACLT98_07015 [Eggerthellaceae bacterium]